MTQVTVEQLAETVGASVDRLLAQMKDAGLPHAAAEEAVSEEDKQRAAARRKAEEQAKKLELDAAVKARAEEAARQAQEATAQPSAKEADRKPKRLHAAPTKESTLPARDELRRRSNKGRLERGNVPGARGKQRGHNLSVTDLEAVEAGVARRRGGRKR